MRHDFSSALYCNIWIKCIFPKVFKIPPSLVTWTGRTKWFVKQYIVFTSCSFCFLVSLEIKFFFTWLAWRQQLSGLLWLTASIYCFTSIVIAYVQFAVLSSPLLPPFKKSIFFCCVLFTQGPPQFDNVAAVAPWWYNNSTHMSDRILGHAKHCCWMNSP